MSFFPVGAHVVDTRTHLHSAVMGCSIESLRVSSQGVILMGISTLRAAAVHHERSLCVIASNAGRAFR